MADVLDEFAATLAPTDSQTLADVRGFVEWQAGRRSESFLLDESDDVGLRTYWLQLRTAGSSRQALRRQVASLKRFYTWATGRGLIESNPFREYNFDRPILSRDQIRRRQQTAVAEPHERELVRLRALNALAEQLNRSADLQSALDATLSTLVEVMGLRTAWAFLLTGAEGAVYTPVVRSAHDFAVVAACGLPPGLGRDDRRYLCQPPDCHCQFLMRAGRLTRAVNIVECSRLQDAVEAAGDTQGLLFHASVPLISQGRPLGLLNVATEEWQFLTAADLQLLSAVGGQVASALERVRLYEVAQAHRARLESELEMARAVQASLLPRQLPDIPGFSLAAEWRSAREVAGDFYDIFSLGGGQWGIVIADVTDKGAPAALYMAMARSLIRATAERTASPAATLLSVNQALCSHSSAEMFVTVFYAILDPAARRLTFANAGHHPPLLRHAGGEVERLPRGSPPLGVLPDIQLADAALSLGPGEALVAYTDGLTDGENFQGDAYGTARLRETIAGAPRAEAQALLAHLLADHAAFTGGAAPLDDITLFVLSAT